MANDNEQPNDQQQPTGETGSSSRDRDERDEFGQSEDGYAERLAAALERIAAALEHTAHGGQPPT